MKSVKPGRGPSAMGAVGAPLDRLYYNTFRFLVSSQFRIIHDVVDIGLGLCLSFLFQ